MKENVLEVQNLVKTYKDFTAVDRVTFSVPRGKVIGFLGPNGAGKTTTIQMLLGITLPTSGSIKYFGKDFFTHTESCLSRINFTSAFNALLGRISAKENLQVFAQLYGVKNSEKKIKELIEYFEIESIMSQIYWNLSAGQKTRVNIVKALLNDPELILMDEPTASLDPDIADKTLTLIEKLKAERHLTILFTSHNMDEVTRICDEVIFLDHGKIVAKDTPANLTKQIDSTKLVLELENNHHVIEKLLNESGHHFTFPTRNRVVIETRENAIPKILMEIGKSGVEIVDIDIQKPTLEDVFLQIARREA